MKRWMGTFALFTVIAATALHAQEPSGAFAGQTPAYAELKGTLSSRNAKVDQPISAELDKPLTLGSTTFPRGSLLLGKVVSVTKHSKDTPDGSLVVVFDHIKPKKGDPVEITSSLYKILPSENMLLAQKTDMAQGGMRGTAADTGNTAALRQNVDADSNRVSALSSASNAPVQVVSAIPGVAIAAISSEGKSGMVTSKNQDVELPSTMNMVVGVKLK